MKPVIFGIVFLISGSILSQDHLTYFGARLNYGYVIIHSRSLRPIKNSYPIGFELDIGRHQTSERAWNSCNCFPKSGMSVAIWDFDNQRVLGYGISAMYYLQPVFGSGKKTSISVRSGIGLSYQTRPYDVQDNRDNQSYSTYIAFPLQLGIALHQKLSTQWSLDLYTVYNHISNGGMKVPNKGINWPTLSFGLSRYTTPPEFPRRIKTDWRESNPKLNRVDLAIFSTYHQPKSMRFIISPGVEVKYARRISRLNNLTLGSEWIYNRGQQYRSTAENPVNGNNLGIAAGHEFILGDFLFGQQFAVYLIKPASQTADVYQRYSLIYNVINSLSIGVSLKAHGHVADFADIRIILSI